MDAAPLVFSAAPVGAAAADDAAGALGAGCALEDEAAAKFHAYEGKEDDKGAGGKDGGKDEKGDEENVKAAVKDAQNEGGQDEKVEFCAGITVTDAEPGTFVAHVPGYKVRFSFSSFLIQSLVN